MILIQIKCLIHIEIKSYFVLSETLSDLIFFFFFHMMPNVHHHFIILPGNRLIQLKNVEKDQVSMYINKPGEKAYPSNSQMYRDD